MAAAAVVDGGWDSAATARCMRVECDGGAAASDEGQTAARPDSDRGAARPSYAGQQGNFLVAEHLDATETGREGFSLEPKLRLPSELTEKQQACCEGGSKTAVMH
eukprot:354973-Chlamydomonas_euryale.AAC.1